jgi:uncharacterized membrane-anchored protein
MIRRGIAFALGLLLLSAVVAQAQPTAAEQKAYEDKQAALKAGLAPKTGLIKLPAAKATMNLGDAYYFLGEKDSRKVLTEGWGNPPEAADGVLGMVFAKGTDFTMPGAWGGVVTFEKTDYVSDQDAATQDYGTVLTQMREGEEQRNKELERKGYPATRLIGWAQAPTYDATRHDLIWARQIQFGDETDHTLNYDVRHLGRHGVLSISMVSAMSHLVDVKSAAAALAQTADFDPGARYADFKEGDKRAGFGLAGLVAAGAGVAVAKKVGLLAVLLLFLKKAGVFIVAGLAGAGAWARKLFSRKKASDSEGPAPPKDLVE